MGLDTVTLVMDIENFFGITISDREASEIRTVQDMADVVAAHLDITEEHSILQEEVWHQVLPLLMPVSSRSPGWDDALQQYLKFEDKGRWMQMEAQLGWHLPRPAVAAGNCRVGLWVLGAFFRTPRYDAAVITVRQWVDTIAAANYREFVDPSCLSNRYEIMAAIAGMVCETAGVDYFEIAPHQQLTHDLGLD